MSIIPFSAQVFAVIKLMFLLIQKLFRVRDQNRYEIIAEENPSRIPSSDSKLVSPLRSLSPTRYSPLNFLANVIIRSAGSYHPCGA